MFKTRCSSLDRNMVCAGSLLPTDQPYNPQTAESKEGTAGHEALAQMVGGAEPHYEAIASRHNADADTLRFFVYRGRMIWTAIGPQFVDVTTERRLSATFGDIVLSGHPDADSIQNGRVLVLDWKLGWDPSDHPYQLLGYAALGLEEHRRRFDGALPDAIVGIEVHIRGGTAETHRWTPHDIAVFAEELNARAKHTDQYGPGPACQYCPRQIDCTARQQWIRSSVLSIADTPETGITPAKVAALWPKAKELERALASYKEVARQIVAEHGALDLGNGQELQIVETKRDRFVPSKALKVMREELKINKTELDSCVRISKTALANAMKARAEKGKGARAVRDLMDTMEAAGAVDEIGFNALRAVKRG